jgi:hypothetical protein
MRNHRNRARIAIILIATVLVIGGCLGVADDQGNRQQVVELARDGQLSPAAGFDVYALPGEFANLSDSGEVVVLRGDALTVMFYKVRGLNHFTGWVYRSNDTLDSSDPLIDGRPATIERLSQNWFFVTVG